MYIIIIRNRVFIKSFLFFFLFIGSQPCWTWFTQWGDPGGFGEGFREYLDVYKAEKVIKRKNLPWVEDDDPIIHYPVIK